MMCRNRGCAVCYPARRPSLPLGGIERIIEESRRRVAEMRRVWRDSRRREAWR